MKLTLIFFLCAGCHICVGYKIATCNANGRLDITETAAKILTCTDIPDDYMFWDFTPSGGTGMRIASCTWSTSTCNINNSDSDYAVIRTQYGTSTLTVKQNHRAKIAGVVRCGGAFNVTVTLPAECSVRVVYPAKQVTNCRTEVNRSNWTVSGSCDVDKIYASDNQYTCLWFHITPSGQQTSFNGTMLLSSFTVNGSEYQRGRCSFSGQFMPTADGVHVYNLRINPGEKQFAGQRLTIQRPVDPVLSNCPAFVTEGNDVNCTCQTSGSPSAVVTWYGSGVIDSVLVLRNVTRSLDGQNYTCNQSWSGVNSNWRTTIYSVQVHYPPSSPPLISGVQDGGHTEGESLSLSCSVTGGQPLVSYVNFWCRQGPTDSADTTTTVNGVTTVTSYLTFDRLDLTMNGTMCQCSAHWSERPSLYTQTATATITVVAKSQTTTTATTTTTVTKTTGESIQNSSGKNSEQRSNDNRDDTTPVAVIAGGAAGGLVLIVIVVVVIVIVMRRRKGTPKSPEKEYRKEEDFEEHVNLTYESSDDVKPTHSKPSAVALRLPANPNTHTAPDATNHDTEEETGFGYASLSDSQPGALKGRSHDLDLDADLYSSADGVGDDGGSVSASAASPGRQQKGADEYSFVSKPKPPKKPQPDPAEYAVVDKSRSKQKGSGSQTPENNGDAASPEVYAQVDKSAKRGNSNPSRPSQPEAQGETYAQVNKSAKRGNSNPSRPSQPEAGGESYAQVQKPKPGAKPIPAKKPKPATAAKPAVLPKRGVLPKPDGQKGNTYDVPPSRQGRPPMMTGYEDVELSNEMTQPTDVDDEYNALDFGKNAPGVPSCDPESQYSHIGAV